MRLLYVLVDDLSPTGAELERLAAGGRAAVGDGCTFTVEPIDVGPRHYYESAVGLAMAVPGILLKVVERQGEFDAILLGCWGDPGLRAARAVARIPVIGPGEASVALSSLVAGRFGVVTIMGSNVPEIEVYLSGIEARHRCAGVNAIDLPFHALAADPPETLRRLEAAGRTLLERGAEALLLGCMSFGFLPFAAWLQDLLGVPVVDPLRAGVEAARAMLALGLLPSPRSVPHLDEPAHLVTYLDAVRWGLAGR
jgi:allantoin racemase